MHHASCPVAVSCNVIVYPRATHDKSGLFCSVVMHMSGIRTDEITALLLPQAVLYFVSTEYA